MAVLGVLLRAGLRLDVVDADADTCAVGSAVGDSLRAAGACSVPLARLLRGALRAWVSKSLSFRRSARLVGAGGKGMGNRLAKENCQTGKSQATTVAETKKPP